MTLVVQSFPDWPAAMSRDLALAYTGVAQTELREWEKRGLVRFLPIGPRGTAITLRLSLDNALTAVFGHDAAYDAIEFD